MFPLWDLTTIYIIDTKMLKIPITGPRCIVREYFLATVSRFLWCVSLNLYTRNVCLRVYMHKVYIHNMRTLWSPLNIWGSKALAALVEDATLYTPLERKTSMRNRESNRTKGSPTNTHQGDGNALRVWIIPWPRLRMPHILRAHNSEF